MRTGILRHDAFLNHSAAGYHPEQPQRLSAIYRELDDRNLMRQCVSVSTREATREEILRVHTPPYLEKLEKLLPGSRGHLDLDTFFSPGTWKASLLAAGGTIKLVSALVDGDLDNGAAFVRPPGHHATPERSMGFCILNNIALAAQAALHRGVERVAIIDWDLHHGNGTQDAFYDNDKVLYLSTHMFPFFPGTGHYTEIGEGKGTGFNVNLPMPPRSGMAEFSAAFRRILLPILRQFHPQLLLVSCGFDAHVSDPIGALKLETEDFRRLNGWVMEAAEELCDRRLALVLEGGYDLRSLGDVSACLVEDLLQGGPHALSPEKAKTEPSPMVVRMIEDLSRLLSGSWKL